MGAISHHNEKGNKMERNKLELYTGKNKAPAGSVLLAYTFKVVKDTASPLFGTKPDSKCAAVAAIAEAELAARVQDFLPRIAELVHDERRLVLRDVALAGGTSLADSECDLDAVLQRWAADAAAGGGGRFSKASIADWYEQVLAPVLLVGVMAKAGVAASDAADDPRMVKVEKVLELVLDTITAVVFAKKRPASETLNNVVAILGKLPATAVSDDETYAFISGKVTGWTKTAEVNLMDNLGF